MKKAIKISSVAIVMVISTIMLTSIVQVLAAPPNPALLDPKAIPKYVNQLVVPPVYVPTNVTDGAGHVIRQDYDINMTYFRQPILPSGTPLPAGSDGKTSVWGYQGKVKLLDGTILNSFAHSPSSTFEAIRGIPINVTWRNNINVQQPFAVDPTLHWANPNMMPMHNTLVAPFPAFPPGFDGTITAFNPLGWDAQHNVPLVTHLHGGEVQSYFDGGPDEWYTWNGIKGPTYSTATATDANAAVYHYPNTQQAATLWYHDHALGMTRLNVMSGLAGFYLLKENATIPVTTPTAANLDQYLTQHFPYGVYEFPIAIQDRTFLTTGELWFPNVGINPTIHPYWMPEFFGNTIMVNGRVWPNLNVKQGWYRFRLLDGSNARFYTLSFSNKMPFTVIGSDGGYLMSSAVVTSLTIAPGERADILVDFSALAPGTKVILSNSARAPFPGGAPADPQTVGQIMQFTVVAGAGATAPILPAQLNPTLMGLAFPTLAAPANQIIRTLFEVMGPAGPAMVTLNGQQWMGDLSEMPKNGTTVDWVIVNLTGDTHPIHLHLVQFQLVSRQPFQASKYMTAWLKLNAPFTPPFPTYYTPKTLDPLLYLQGKPVGPLPNEMGWKDTVQMNPGEVTIIRVRYMAQDGTKFPFDATQGPGYVWHCHIIDHEDNEMMRPYKVIP